MHTLVQTMLKYVCCIILLCGLSNEQEYEVPPATIEILHPKGFTVSIPDQEGIRLFAFHGNINQEFDSRDAGQFARDITRPQNGRWTFSDKSQRFKPGDVIYYWLYVDYFDGKNKLGYLRENQKYVVREIPKNNANKNKNKGNQGNQGNQGNHGNPHNRPPDESFIRPTTLQPTTLQPTKPPVSDCYSPTKINRNVCSGELIFNEDFEEINSNKWQMEIRFATQPDYEFVIYGIGRSDVYVTHGELHIKPTVADEIYGVGFLTLPGGINLGLNCTGIPDTLECKQEPLAFLILPPVLSGRINSKPSFSFLYGRIDIRAKLPKGDWIYPELYLTPKKYEYGSENYDSGEIRIAFLPGNANLNNELEGGIMLGTSDEVRKYGLKKLKSETAWNQDFHIFSAVWKPDVIQLLVDNKIYGNIYPPPGGFSNVLADTNPEAAIKWKTGDVMAPFDKEMFITVGLGVGGHSFQDSLPGKPYSNVDGKGQYKFYKAKNSWFPTWSEESELIVDYIKVYAI